MEDIKVVVNGVLWGRTKQSGALGSIVEVCMEKLNYMSREAMIEWLLESCNLAEETLSWKKNATLARRINYIREYLKHRDPSREVVMSMIVNTVLSGHGLGNLSGFGYKIGKARSKINPEIMSIRNIKE